MPTFKLKKNNGITNAEEILDMFKNEALKILNKFPESNYKNSIIYLLDFIIQRNK